MVYTQHETMIERFAAGQIMTAALAAALADPRSPLGGRCDGDGANIIHRAWRRLVSDTKEARGPELGIAERLPAQVDACSLVEWLGLSTREREPVHQQVFGLVVSRLCPAYETEYCAWKDTTHRSQELADIAGFYRAFGLRVSKTAPDRVDHVSLEIEFVSLLHQKQRLALLADARECAAICHDARAAFLRDHVAWWVPTFGRLLEKRALSLDAAKGNASAGLPVFAGVARLLCAWVAVERILCDVEPIRRIISPSVAPQEIEDNCGSCADCSEPGAQA